MTISACLIVKNEEKLIRNCIDKLLGNIDEIIIVDTGSTDGTIQIIEDYVSKKNVKIVHFRECNFSFSIARNIAIDNATSEWILFLDADEYVEELHWSKIYRLMNEELLAYALLIQNYFPNGLWSSFPVTRLFKKHCDIKYEKNIHETINYSLRRLGIIPKIESVCIHHVGYLDSMLKQLEKAKQYKSLLWNQIKLESKDPSNWWYLAICDEVLNDHNNAMLHIKKAISLDFDNKIPRIFYSRFLMKHENNIEAIRYLEHALEINGMEYWDSTIYNLLGIANLNIGDNKNALYYLIKAVNLEKQYPHIWINLGIAYKNKGDNKKMKECYEQAVIINPQLEHINVDLVQNNIYDFQEDISRQFTGCLL